jgi:TP901 family phage tail tape measure protein
MTAGNMTAALHLVLDDKISAGLKLMTKQLDGLRDAGKQIGLGKLTSGLEELRRGISSATSMKGVISAIGSAAERSGQQIKRMAQDLAFAAKYHATLGMQSLGRSLNNASHPNMTTAREQIGVIGGAAAGYSVIEPMRKYSEQEVILRQIAITKGLSGNAAEMEIQRLDKLINADARESGQSNHSIAEAYLDLQGQGIPTGMIDKVIKQHSMAATAYGISPEVLGPAVGALITSFKVPEDQIGATLAAMAGASKAGRFKINDFATHLPGVAASFSSAGIKGREGAVMSFAALETVMKNVGEPGQAATSLNEVLSTVFSPFAERFFAKKGIDLGGMLRAAEKQGVDPLTAVLGKLQKLTAGKTDVETKQILGALVRDQTARTALVALLQHKDDYLGLRKTLGGANQATLQGDFGTQAAGPDFQMKMFNVNTEILGQELGKTFLPIMKLINWALDKLTDSFIWLNENMPQTTSIVMSVAGGMILLGGALGILATVWPAITAGFSLMLALVRISLMPFMKMWRLLVVIAEGLGALAGISAGAVAVIAVLAAVLVAAAVDIYEHWGRFKGFFIDLWAGLADVFGGVTEFLQGILIGDWGQMLDGLKRLWGGLGEFFGGLWGIIKQLFVDFGGWIDSWTDGAMTAGINKIKDAWNGLKSFFIDLWKEIAAPFDHWLDGISKALAKLTHTSQTLPVGNEFGGVGLPDQAVVPAPAHRLNVTVGAEPGTHAAATSPDPNVSVTHASPLAAGRVLGRD